MTQVVSDLAISSIFNAYLNNVRPANTLVLPSANDLQLRLFVNNITPNAGGGDTTATYVEAAGGGYLAKTLSSGSWTVNANNPIDVTYAIQTWTFTGGLTTNVTAYGYYIVDAANTLVTSELLPAPFIPASSGDVVSVTPRIAGSSGTPTA